MFRSRRAQAHSAPLRSTCSRMQMHVAALGLSAFCCVTPAVAQTPWDAAAEIGHSSTSETDPWSRAAANAPLDQDDLTPWGRALAATADAPKQTQPARGPASWIVATTEKNSLARAITKQFSADLSRAAAQVSAIHAAQKAENELIAIVTASIPDEPDQPIGDKVAKTADLKDWSLTEGVEVAPDFEAPMDWAVIAPPPPERYLLDDLEDALDPVDRLVGDPFDKPYPELKRAAPPPPGERYSLEGVSRLLLSTNEDVLIARERAETARIDYDLATKGMAPEVDLEIVGEGLREKPFWKNHTDSVRAQVSLSASKRLYDFGATDADIQRARQAHLQALATARSTSENALSRMLENYLNVAKSDEIIEASRRNITSLRKISELVRLSEEQGNATLADVRRVSSRLDAALGSQIQLASTRDTAANAFTRLTGLRPEALGKDDVFALAHEASSVTPDMLADNPDLNVLTRQLASLESQYRATQRGRLPTLDLEAGAGYSVSAEGSSDEALSGSVSLLFSMKLFDGGKNDLQKKRVSSQIQETRLRLAKERRRIEEEAKNSTHFGRTDSDKTKVLKDRVASLEKVAELYVEQFAGGQRTVFELLESEADLLSARVEEITHRYERLSTAFKQLRLAGRLAETTLGTGK